MIGSGPAGLINAYLLAAEGFPVTIFEAFHELGGVLRYGIPEFRLPNSLIDDVVRKIRLLGRPVRHQFRRRQDRDPRGFEARRLLEDFRRHRRRPAALHERAGRASARRHVGQRVPDPRQSDAGALRRLRDPAARGEGQEHRRHRRRKHRHGRGPHRQTPRRCRHHRLSPHQGRNAGAGRGTASRARGRDRAHGAQVPARIHQREIRPCLPRDPRRDGARAARRLGPAVAGRHRQDRDDAGRSRHHGARQCVEPDHQGLGARAEDFEVGNDQRRQRHAQDIARRRLFRRRRDPRRRDRRSCCRRRTGCGARDRRRHTLLPRGDRRPRRERLSLHRHRPGAAADPQEGRSGGGHRRNDGEVAADRQGGAGGTVRPRSADAERRTHPAHPRRLGRKGRHDRSRHPGGRREYRSGSTAMEVGEALSGIAGPLGQPSRAASLRGRPDRGLLRRRARPAAGLPDHARAPRTRQPRHPDRRLPHRGRALLDGRRASASTSCRRSSATSSR